MTEPQILEVQNPTPPAPAVTPARDLYQYDRAISALLVARGTVLLKAGDADGAIAEFDQAILRDPGHALAYQGRAVAHTAAGRPELARADAETAARLDPLVQQRYASPTRQVVGYRVVAREYDEVLVDYPPTPAGLRQACDHVKQIARGEDGEDYEDRFHDQPFVAVVEEYSTLARSVFEAQSGDEPTPASAAGDPDRAVPYLGYWQVWAEVFDRPGRAPAGLTEDQATALTRTLEAAVLTQLHLRTDELTGLVGALRKLPLRDPFGVIFDWGTHRYGQQTKRNLIDSLWRNRRTPYPDVEHTADRVIGVVTGVSQAVLAARRDALALVPADAMATLEVDLRVFVTEQLVQALVGLATPRPQPVA
jgi:tetratricopeptide (TPR) repeat protein